MSEASSFRYISFRFQASSVAPKWAVSPRPSGWNPNGAQRNLIQAQLSFSSFNGAWKWKLTPGDSSTLLINLSSEPSDLPSIGKLEYLASIWLTSIRLPSILSDLQFVAVC